MLHARAPSRQKRRTGTRTRTSTQRGAPEAHCSHRCRGRSIGSLKTVKLFFEKGRTFLHSVVLLSGCRAPRRAGCRRPSSTRALVSLIGTEGLRSYPSPFLFLGEEKRVFSSSPCLPSPEKFCARFLLFLSSLLPPQTVPLPWQLRRVGVGPRLRIGVGADAAELPGPLVSSRAEAEASSLLFVARCRRRRQRSQWRQIAASTAIVPARRRRSRHRQVLSHCTDLQLDPHRNWWSGRSCRCGGGASVLSIACAGGMLVASGPWPVRNHVSVLIHFERRSLTAAR